MPDSIATAYADQWLIMSVAAAFPAIIPPQSRQEHTIR